MSNINTLQPFKPGNDPRRNTKGRPKGQKEFVELLRKELKKKVIVNGKKVSQEEALVLRLISSAYKGKFWAYKLLMDYIYGKPNEAKKSKNGLIELSSIERKKKIQERARQVFDQN